MYINKTFYVKNILSKITIYEENYIKVIVTILLVITLNI